MHSIQHFIRDVFDCHSLCCRRRGRSISTFRERENIESFCNSIVKANCVCVCLHKIFVIHFVFISPIYIAHHLDIWNGEFYTMLLLNYTMMTSTISLRLSFVLFSLLPCDPSSISIMAYHIISVFCCFAIPICI